MPCEGMSQESAFSFFSFSLFLVYLLETIDILHKKQEYSDPYKDFCSCSLQSKSRESLSFGSSLLCAVSRKAENKKKHIKIK